eukprot:TRINITY_DN18413_c0_g1_i1.p1 TRINITY_DN18413_c0_g1~~TRINITY_DN18413_c0_g1_i1.p1  ORF type:complete len:615 (-),score=89.05 TRINITY_DN18413_c0_g1_i1:122-1966(-)
MMMRALCLSIAASAVSADDTLSLLQILKGAHESSRARGDKFGCKLDSDRCLAAESLGKKFPDFCAKATKKHCEHPLYAGAYLTCCPKTCLQRLRVRTLNQAAKKFFKTHGQPVSPRCYKECDVAVLGGGIAGLYSAFRLADKANVCLFEANDYFGGRIKDEKFHPDGLGGVEKWVGVGGGRVDDGQHVVKHLANELEMNLEYTEYGASKVNVRGLFSDNSAGTRAAFPTLTTELDEDGMYEKFMGEINWDEPRLSVLPDLGNYSTVEDYLRGLFGPEGLRFLQDNFRFRADFTDNDVRSYLQFLILDIAENSAPPQKVGYPVDGMSQFAHRMSARASAMGASLHLKDPVLSISGSKQAGYRVMTQQHIVHAKKIIIAMDPDGMNSVTGNIAERLKQDKSFQDAKPIPVSVVVQRFPGRWWEDAYDGKVHRAWTTDNCVSFTDPYINPYAKSTKVVRSVFADGYCASYWKTLHDADPSLGLIEKELKRSLSYLWNMTVPDAIETRYQYWPNGWYFQQPHAGRDIYELEQWAKRPFSDEDVALANEAWSPYRAWIKGPIFSAINALNEQHGLGLQIPTDSPALWPSSSSKTNTNLISVGTDTGNRKITGASLRERR